MFVAIVASFFNKTPEHHRQFGCCAFHSWYLLDNTMGFVIYYMKYKHRMTGKCERLILIHSTIWSNSHDINPYNDNSHTKKNRLIKIRMSQHKVIVCGRAHIYWKMYSVWKQINYPVADSQFSKRTSIPNIIINYSWAKCSNCWMLKWLTSLSVCFSMPNARHHFRYLFHPYL